MNFIAELATTNLRTAVGLVEAFAYVIVNLIALWLGHHFDDSTNITVGAFIAIQQGLDVTQFLGKRATFTPEAHEAPPREDVQPPKPPAAAPAAVQEAP